jgi:hypothetical protein
MTLTKAISVEYQDVTGEVDRMCKVLTLQELNRKKREFGHRS